MLTLIYGQSPQRCPQTKKLKRLRALTLQNRACRLLLIGVFVSSSRDYLLPRSLPVDDTAGAVLTNSFEQQTGERIYDSMGSPKVRHFLAFEWLGSGWYRLPGVCARSRRVLGKFSSFTQPFCSVRDRTSGGLE